MDNQDKIKHAKLRGGRPTTPHKNKKQYNRKKEKKRLNSDLTSLLA
ncbi:MAG: hypothetical protein WC260_01410 [Candidatus Pacearchaeota archaeon]